MPLHFSLFVALFRDYKATTAYDEREKELKRINAMKHQEMMAARKKKEAVKKEREVAIKAQEAARKEQEEAKKETWHCQHEKMTASGTKSITLLVTATIKLVIEDANRLKQLAREQELKRQTKITDIPAEVHLLIFEYLDPVDSTCLGLACKNFYQIHQKLHGSVALWQGGYKAAWHMSPPTTGLWFRLKDWFPDHLQYNFATGKFVTEKEYKKLLKQRKARRNERAARKRQAKRRTYSRYRGWR